MSFKHKNMKKMHKRLCMEKILKNIIDYLEYLNNELNYNVTVHFTEKCISRIPEKFFSKLLPYNVHKNPYCIFVKKNKWEKCICSQREIQKINAKEGLCRICHAGVKEFVQLFFSGEEVLGYVAVSGFRELNANLLPEDFARWQAELSAKPFPKKACDALIPPLCRMFETFFSFPMQKENDEYNLILQYIFERHGQVGLEELAIHFSRSKSYLSHLFNARSGITLKAYCNKLKLDYAKMLLTATDKTVTDIAFEVGYNDVAYFIGLFKETFKKTPLQYRKQIKKA